MRQQDDQADEFGHDNGQNRGAEGMPDEPGEPGLPRRVSGAERARLGSRVRSVIDAELLARVLRGLQTYD